MRAAVLRAARMVFRDDVPEPVPEAGQVLVALRACGICGSDLHFARHGAELLALNARVEGGNVFGQSVDLDADVFMGHEFSAEVIEAGPETAAPPAGTLVTSVPVLLSGAGVKPIVFSNTTVGGYAERMLLSAPLLLEVPNGLDARHAALTEPMAVGLHAVNRSKITTGESALVLGCGPIGIAVIAALRHRGVETIVAADFSPKRRELASALGASVTVDPALDSPFAAGAGWPAASHGARPAVVFEAVGVPGILDDILRRAPAGSRVVVVGVCIQADTVHPYFGIVKELSVQFSAAYDPSEFAETLHAIADGSVDVSPLITGTVGLREVDQAFAELADPSRHCKVLVTP
jgi:threonine dehydrogenase-like Zn-dependent dehydrogenase